jgi:Family of unknown function (DUF5675)
MDLYVIRDPAGVATQTYGEMDWNATDQIILQTLELPWVPDPNGAPGGHPDTSCVPCGTYQLVLHNTAAHPETFALVNPALGVYHEPGDIPAGHSGRFACLIHSANLVTQLAGCIGVGLTRSWLGGEPDIADSVNAFTELKEAVPWEAGHTLQITQAGAYTP